MNVEKVKETAEEMAVKIFEYIDAAGLSQEESDHLTLELATSFLTCAVHKTEKIEAMIDINNKCVEIRGMAVVGYWRFLDGNKERVKKDLSK